MNIIEQALKELNEEGLFKGLKITEQGKKKAEEIIKSKRNYQDALFKTLWKKLKDEFYELDAEEFAIKVLKLEELLKKSGIDLYENFGRLNRNLKGIKK